VLQDTDYEYLFANDGSLLEDDSTTASRFDAFNINTLSGNLSDDDYFRNNDYSNEEAFNAGGRYGLDPELSTSNGVFIENTAEGKISFSSNLSGMFITLKYVSDGLGTDAESKVHKFAEQAMYECIA